MTERKPIPITIDGRTWVFEPTDQPSDYRSGDLRLRDHARRGGGWSVAPDSGTALYELGVIGHQFLMNSPPEAMRAFLEKYAGFMARREAEDAVLRAHQLLPDRRDEVTP